MAINIDADPNDADWLKHVRNLRTRDGERIKTKRDFLKYLRERGKTLDEFRQLPIARTIPEDWLK